MDENDIQGSIEGVWMESVNDYNPDEEQKKDEEEIFMPYDDEGRPLGELVNEDEFAGSDPRSGAMITGLEKLSRSRDPKSADEAIRTIGEFGKMPTVGKIKELANKWFKGNIDKTKEAIQTSIEAHWPKDSFNEAVNLKGDTLSSAKYQEAKKLKSFKKEDWKWDSKQDLYVKQKSVNESAFEDVKSMFKFKEKTPGARDMALKNHMIQKGPENKIYFDYDPETEKYAVAMVRGFGLNRNIISKFGLESTRTWTAGIGSYVGKDGSPAIMDEQKFKDLVSHWEGGRGREAKSQADFYKGWDKYSGTVDEVTSKKQKGYMCAMAKSGADRPKGLSKAEAEEMCKSKVSKKKLAEIIKGEIVEILSGKEEI